MATVGTLLAQLLAQLLPRLSVRLARLSVRGAPAVRMAKRAASQAERRRVFDGTHHPARRGAWHDARWHEAVRCAGVP